MEKLSILMFVIPYQISSLPQKSLYLVIQFFKMHYPILL